MKKIKFLVLTTLIALLPLVISAQDEPKNPLFLVVTHHLQMDKMDSHKKLVAEVKGLIKKYNADVWDWHTVIYEEGDVSFLMPIENFATLDKFMWEDLAAKGGEAEMKGIGAKLEANIKGSSESVIELMPDKSYMPKDSKTLDGHNFRYVEAFYVKPGKMDELMDIAGQILAIHQKNNSKQHYQIYKNRFGGESDVIYVVSFAKDMTTVLTNEKADYEKSKAELKPLYEKVRPMINDMEREGAWYAPSLSHIKQKQGAKEQAMDVKKQ